MRAARRFTLGFGAVYACLMLWSLRSERPEFRPWELVKDPDTPYFFPGRRVEMTEIGDLGWRSWVHALQEPRPTLFTTDRRGFRNPDDQPPPRVVLLGDSFVAGSGLRDEETLRAQLAGALGVTVASVAVETANSPSLYLSEPLYRDRPPAVVVFAPVNRLLKPLTIRPGDYRRPKERPAGLAAAGPALRRLNERLGRDNGLGRAMRFGYNGALYRLRGHADAIAPEGRTALALSLAEQRCFDGPDARALAEVIATAVELERILRRQGTALVYAPIPDSAEVYPELFPPEQIARCARPSMFDRLVPEARAAGLRVVDLRAAFRADKSPYLYRRDDSHWGPRAVRIAAGALAAAIEPGPPRP